MGRRERKWCSGILRITTFCTRCFHQGSQRRSRFARRVASLRLSPVSDLLQDRPDRAGRLGDVREALAELVSCVKKPLRRASKNWRKLTRREGADGRVSRGRSRARSPVAGFSVTVRRTPRARYRSTLNLGGCQSHPSRVAPARPRPDRGEIALSRSRAREPHVRARRRIGRLASYAAHSLPRSGCCPAVGAGSAQARHRLVPVLVRQLLRAIASGTHEQEIIAQPDAQRTPIPVFCKRALSVFFRRDVGQIEISSMVEEPAEQEVALQGFHVVRQAGHGSSGFIESLFQVYGHASHLPVV